MVHQMVVDRPYVHAVTSWKWQPCHHRLLTFENETRWQDLIWEAQVQLRKPEGPVISDNKSYKHTTNHLHATPPTSSHVLITRLIILQKVAHEYASSRESRRSGTLEAHGTSLFSQHLIFHATSYSCLISLWSTQNTSESSVSSHAYHFLSSDS